MSTAAKKFPDIARLLEAVEQLSLVELNTVEERLQAAKVKQKAALALTPEEKRRLEDIAREVPPEIRSRYAALVARRHEENFNDAEQEELVHLSDWIERIEVKRLEYVAELARQRNVPLLTFMDALRIKSPSYA